MNAHDEAGMLMLAEGVPAKEQGSCGRNQLREGTSKVRKPKESVLSLAVAARRTGSVVVVLGPENTRILCEVCPLKPSGLRWFADGVEVAASKISYLLENVQGDRAWSMK